MVTGLADSDKLAVALKIFTKEENGNQLLTYQIRTVQPFSTRMYIVLKLMNKKD